MFVTSKTIYILSYYLISLIVSELLSQTPKNGVELSALYTALMCDWAIKIVIVVLTLYRCMNPQSSI